MHSLTRVARWIAGVTILASVIACSESVGVNSSLIVRGPGAPPAGASSNMLVRATRLFGAGIFQPGETVVGDPAQVQIGMYALYLPAKTKIALSRCS